MVSLVQNNKTYVFSETNGQQVGEYDFSFIGSIKGTSELFLVDQNGSLWRHNSKNVPRNTFFGTRLPSKVSVIANQHSSTVKTFQSISLESTHPCSVVITTDMGYVLIPKSRFVEKEGIWYADIPRDISKGGNGIEGPVLKGRYAKVDLTYNGEEEFEIFAVNLAYSVSSNNF